MAKITKVEPQKRNPERCNLYLDGEFVCAMSMLVVVQNQLLPGKEITQEKLLDMVFELFRSGTAFADSDIEQYERFEK